MGPVEPDHAREPADIEASARGEATAVVDWPRREPAAMPHSLSFFAANHCRFTSGPSDRAPSVAETMVTHARDEKVCPKLLIGTYELSSR